MGKKFSVKFLVALLIVGMAICLTGCDNGAKRSSQGGKIIKAVEESNNDSNKKETSTEVYPHDILKDRKSFDADNIEIVVGDDHYATKMNDWYANTEDYVGRTVEIDGYYIDDGYHKFVGRKGPTCPYCKGGYVAFEISGDQDFSKLETGKSWIRVQGIIRQGSDSNLGPFPYLEAINVIHLPEVGVDTVKN